MKYDKVSFMKVLASSENINYSIHKGVYVGPAMQDKNTTIAGRADLISLGKLYSVAGDLSLPLCQNLQDTGELRVVTGNLCLQDCPRIKDLGKITYVLRTIDLSGCSNISSLGNLSSSNPQDPSGITSLGTKVRLSKEDRIMYDLEVVLEKVAYYQSLPLHEALNALHSKKVQSKPLYINILTNKLQGHNTPL
jgi:hypothetical protein